MGERDWHEAYKSSDPAAEPEPVESNPEEELHPDIKMFLIMALVGAAVFVFEMVCQAYGI